jgi:predicted AlkP superfamily pyrophosphatase or phosphodiesterase
MSIGLRSRVLLVGAIAIVVAAGALFMLKQEPLVPEDAPTQDEMAEDLGSSVMQHLYRGHVPERSGDLLVVPRPNHYLISEWDLRTLDDEKPFEKTTHAGPWKYLTHVPIVAYDPAIVEAGQELAEPVDIAALAPTYARLLGMDDFESPSCSLEVVVPCELEGGIGNPPRVVFTVVIDGGGWNVLRRYPDAWPNIKSLMNDGATYTNATIGSAPSTTGALHATFGTGFYPNEHGLPGNILRTEDGEIEDVYLDDADPRFLQKPTISELWDEQNDNEPVVATISFEGWHLGMIGHGAQREGGDKDLAAIWDRPERAWEINEEFYELPSFLENTDVAALSRYERALDARDGREDGQWFSETPLSLRRNKNERASSPAFARLTGDAVVDLIDQGDIGTDPLTDLVWIELKIPDSAGHAWNLEYPEVEDVLRETDAQVGRFRAALDRVVGEGRYLFVLSADHGQQPLPDADEGWRINTSELERDIVTHFGPVVDAPSPADIYLDRDALRSAGVTADDIARWLGTYTVEDNIPEGAPGKELVPRGRLDDRLFAGVFSTDFFASLTPENIAGFGDSTYPEGNYPTELDD